MPINQLKHNLNSMAFTFDSPPDMQGIDYLLEVLANDFNQEKTTSDYEALEETRSDIDKALDIRNDIQRRNRALERLTLTNAADIR